MMEIPKLSRRQRAIPWLWMGIAILATLFGLATGASTTAVVMGALIMCQLARMENAACVRALIFASALDALTQRRSHGGR